mmetsp:Transcript_48509/g.128546  ORF Transcript_48509/g.128546 Transcript_48509/m.128546 type:complete len:564 (-) Transcript_48509:134-1825(-)
MSTLALTGLALTGGVSLSLRTSQVGSPLRGAGADLGSLSNTMKKLRCDEERVENRGVHTLQPMPRSCVVTENPPSSHAQSLVQVLVGPVIGSVTDRSLVILLEVDISAAVTLVLTAQGCEEPSRKLQRRLPAYKPTTFVVDGLSPSTEYVASFVGLAPCEDSQCTVRTLPREADVRQITIVAMSGDYPREWEDGEESPYAQMLDIPESVDHPLLFLHLGDQVNTSLHCSLNRAIRLLQNYDDVHPLLATKKNDRATHAIQEAYRHTWSQDDTREVLKKGQHMMLWSENDMANGYTLLRDEKGEQVYHPQLLRCAFACYRMYQRQLWDPERALEVAQNRSVEEWQFRRVGPLGIFLIDMRGARLLGSGSIVDGPLMSATQKNALKEALASGITGLIVGSELPFVGDTPDEIRKKVVEGGSGSFLVEHWPYHVDELVWLLEQIFDWKAAQVGREVMLLGGGTNCGAESLIQDRRHCFCIRHITTSPVTDYVEHFHPVLKGHLNNRFSYEHRPFAFRRNFCRISASFSPDGACKLSGELVGCKTKDFVVKERSLASLRHRARKAAG